LNDSARRPKSSWVVASGRRHVAGSLDGLEHAADGDGGHDDDRGEQADADDHQEVGEQPEGLLLEAHRVEEIGLVVALRRADRRTDHQGAAGLAARGRVDVQVGDLRAGEDRVDELRWDRLQHEPVVGPQGVLRADQDDRGKAGLGGGGPGAELLEDALPGLGGRDVGGTGQSGGGLVAEPLDLGVGLVELLGVQRLGKQGVQGGAEQQQRGHHDQRGEQHHPGP
jgi:hypothetical protein